MAIKIEMPRGGADGAPAVEITTQNEAIKINKEETKKEVSFSVEIDEVTEEHNGLAKPNDKKVLDTTIFDADTFRSGNYDTAQDAWNTAIAPKDTIGKYRHINGTELAWRDKDGKTRKSRYIEVPRISKGLNILRNWNNIEWIPEWNKFFISAQTYDGTNRGYLGYAFSENGQDWIMNQYDVVEMWGRSCFGNGKLVVASWFKTEQIAVFDGEAWQTINLQGISNNFIWCAKYINEQFVFITSSENADNGITSVNATRTNKIVLYDKDLNHIETWDIFSGSFYYKEDFPQIYHDITYRDGFYYLANYGTDGVVLKSDNIQNFKINVSYSYGSMSYEFTAPNTTIIRTASPQQYFTLTDDGEIIGGTTGNFASDGNKITIIHSDDTLTESVVPYEGDTAPYGYTQVVKCNEEYFFADSNGYIYISQDGETWESLFFDVVYNNFGNMVTKDGLIYILSGANQNRYANGSNPRQMSDICYIFDPVKRKLNSDYWQDMPVLSVPTDGILASVNNEFKTAELDAYLRYRDNTLGAVVREEPTEYKAYRIVMDDGRVFWCPTPFANIIVNSSRVFADEELTQQIGNITDKDFNPNNPQQVEFYNSAEGTLEIGNFEPAKIPIALASIATLLNFGDLTLTEKMAGDVSSLGSTIDLNTLTGTGFYFIPYALTSVVSEYINMPVDKAGVLVVLCSENLVKWNQNYPVKVIIQKFIPYDGASSIYVRTGMTTANGANWQGWATFASV